MNWLDGERVNVFDFMKNPAADDSPFAQHMKGTTFMIATRRPVEPSLVLEQKIG